ncbi:MAG: tyrosine-type recombinase/integrase [Halothermotrichaceae bacterium]
MRLTKLLKKANLPTKYGIHTLRHTFANISLENKVSPKVQIMLGHSTISFSCRY